MKTKKFIRKKSIWLVALITVFATASPLLHYSKADENDSSNTEIIWDNDQTVEGTFNVPSGKTLIIKDGITVTFGSYAHIDVSGSLFVNGTVKHPIYFKSGKSNGGYSIRANSGGKIVVKGADISGAGTQVYPAFNNRFNLIDTVNASTYEAGFIVKGGELEIQGSLIHDNKFGVGVEKNGDPTKVVVQRSEFINNETDAYNNSDSSGFMDFRFNWWGDKSGPSQDCYDYNNQKICYNDKAYGNISFEPWRSEEKFHDPVIIIPGILGSQKKDGEWVLDPVLHTYDNLYQELSDNGYVPEKDLFEFPYEWRDSNVDNAKLLRDKINEIKEETKWPKVDIVAHSMGGLLAREYVESDYYQDDVDQLVTIGTPQDGAPEAYLKWDGDGWFFDMEDIVIKYILGQEAKESGQADIFDYIHNRPIESLREMLPVYDYLQDVNNGYKYKSYPIGYPDNPFLENLNKVENISKLNNIEFDKIIGKLNDNESTISGLKVINADMGRLWKDGYPLGFEIPIGDQGLIYDDGDGTVPLVSGESINIYENEKIILKSNHLNLPTDSQKDVLELLTGKRPETENRDSLIKDIFIASVFSPIDIQVVDKNGKRVGRDFQNPGHIFNEIPGAYYSGYDNVDNEFLTIPNPEDGEYKILTQGTGNGEYKIKTAKISEDENSQEATESVAEISGTAVTGQQEEKTVTVENNQVTTEKKDTTPPVITGHATTEPNANGWYNQDVTVHFEATDDSGTASVTPDIILSTEGANQSAVGTAIDAAGNSASFTVDKINIDKSAPASTVDFSGTKGNNDWFTGDVGIKFSASDNLSGIDTINFSLDGADFQKGNSLVVSSEGEHSVRYYSQDKAENKEGIKEAKIKIDKNPPIVSINSPQSRQYLDNKVLDIKYSVQDSATKNTSTSIFYDGKNYSSKNIDLSLEHLGIHSLSAVSHDEAGNKSAEAKVNFEVTTSIVAIISNIDHYFNLGLITKKAVRNDLDLKLASIGIEKETESALEKIWLPKLVKDKMISNLKHQINSEIDAMISGIQNPKNNGAFIAQKARELLVESLGKIRI